MNSVLVDRSVMSERGHTARGGYRCGRRGPRPPRHPPGRARPVRVAHPRRGVGDGGGGAPRRRRRARAEARSARRAGRRRRRRRGAALRLARGDQARQRARALRDRRRAAAAASTSAPRPAGSPTACCSTAPQHVVALDVAYGELDWRLRNDERVTVLERTNARAIAPARAALRAGPRRHRRLVHLADEGAAGGARDCAAPVHDVLAMVKPQFEAGRGNVGKGGVVRDPDQRRPCSSRSPNARAGSAPPCSASPPPGCPGRRATARASSGSPRPAAPATAATTLEAAAREVEP